MDLHHSKNIPTERLPQEQEVALRNKTVEQLLHYLLTQFSPEWMISQGYLSLHRAHAVLYLIDWKAAIEFGEQMSTIQWYFRREGVMPDEQTQAYMVALLNDEEWNDNLHHSVTMNITEMEQAVIQHVVHTVCEIEDRDLGAFILSTFPVTGHPRPLRLAECAQDYDRTRTINIT